MFAKTQCGELLDWRFLTSAISFYFCGYLTNKSPSYHANLLNMPAYNTSTKNTIEESIFSFTNFIQITNHFSNMHLDFLIGVFSERRKLSPQYMSSVVQDCIFNILLIFPYSTNIFVVRLCIFESDSHMAEFKTLASCCFSCIAVLCACSCVLHLIQKHIDDSRSASYLTELLWQLK